MVEEHQLCLKPIAYHGAIESLKENAQTLDAKVLYPQALYHSIL